MHQLAGRRIDVQGTVQGVGFRPWVYQLAHELRLTGSVKNGPEGVTIEAFGPGLELDRLLVRLRMELPPAARIETLKETPLVVDHAPETFVILRSDVTGDARPSIPADLAMCDACRAEVNDPHARRYQYAFTNCTHCGPRFSIAVSIPYDRPNTTMSAFPLCDECRAEYENPLDRRFHAQPIACPVCGPKLGWREADGSSREVADVLEVAANALLAGKIVAVRGLGGFHLACDAGNADAVAELRRRKHRDEKPFAVMVPSLEWARGLAALTDEEERLLLSPARPIVLAKARGHGELVGLFLPYTPLHELLLAKVARPLVMTSGNRSDEPMVVENDEALTRLRGIADGFVVHDRPIATRTDDSVARVVAGAPMLVRRARGFVPDPMRAPLRFPEPVLAVGGQLKNTFCIGHRDLFTLGPHVGDLEDFATFTDLTRLVPRMERFLEVEPRVVVHDLHPDYESTLYAMGRRATRRIAVQHHHAHVAAVMAEHGLTERVLGLAFDGTGYGTDGAAWGGEFLVCTPAHFERRATFRPMAMVGGEQAIRQPWRLALAALDDAFDGDAPLAQLAAFELVSSRDVQNVRSVLRTGDALQAHGVGRVFDAAAALILARPRAGYEAQLAVALEAEAAHVGAVEPWPFALVDGQLDLRPMWCALVYDLLAGVTRPTLAARFHATVATASAAMARHVLAQTGPMPVVLTGGCFVNARLTEALLSELSGLDVRLPRRAPPGDGGLALGQAYVAAALLSAERS